MNWRKKKMNLPKNKTPPINKKVMETMADAPNKYIGNMKPKNKTPTIEEEARIVDKYIKRNNKEVYKRLKRDFIKKSLVKEAIDESYLLKKHKMDEIYMEGYNDALVELKQKLGLNDNSPTVVMSDKATAEKPDDDELKSSGENAQDFQERRSER